MRFLEKVNLPLYVMQKICSANKHQSANCAVFYDVFLSIVVIYFVACRC